MNNLPKSKILLVAFLATIAVVSYRLGYEGRANEPPRENQGASIIANSSGGERSRTALSPKRGQMEIPDSAPDSIRENSSTKSVVTQNENDFVPVLRVIDGDTIVVGIDDQDVHVRLIGIDSPELRDKRPQVACFGEKAREEAEKLLADRNVKLEKDPTQGDYDKYGRMLAYAILPPDSTSLTASGTNFNKLMVEEGYAYEYTYNLPYKYQMEFKEAQNEARSAQKGLWNTNICN